MLPRDILKRLPSVSELLDKPQVRAVIDRVPVRDVTQRTRKFLDRVVREVQRRSADLSIPSISELAERAAKFLMNEHEAQPHVVINATGRFWSSELPSPPLADEATSRVLRMGDGYWHVAAGREEIEQRVAKLAGAEAALVLNSHAAALCVALSAVSDQGVAIARGDVGTLACGARVSELAKLAGCPLREVGASDQVTLDDYSAGGGNLGGAVQIDLGHSTGSASESVDTAAMATSVHRHGGLLIHDIGLGPLVSCEATAGYLLTTAADVVAAGVDIVVLRGDGWLGGPSCGLLVGKQAIVETLATSALARMATASAETIAALAGTLDCYTPAEQAKLTIPLLSLATAPLENLRTRAERLAPQIAAASDVLSAKVIDIAADAAPVGMPRLASVAIEVTPAAERIAKLRAQVAEATPTIRFVDKGTTWLLNMRAVLPSQDIALASAFEPVAEVEVTGDVSENGVPSDEA